MVDVGGSLSDERRPDARVRQLRSVPFRSTPPVVVPLIQTPELDLQNCGLKSIEPAVEPDLGVVVVRGSTMVAQSFDPLGDRCAVGGDRSSITVCSEILPRVKRKTGDIAERPGSDPLILGSMRLGSVFNYKQTAPSCEVLDRTHVRGLAKEVNCNDRLRAACQGPLDHPRIDRVGIGIDIDENRLRSRRYDGGGGGDESMSGRNHLVT